MNEVGKLIQVLIDDKNQMQSMYFKKRIAMLNVRYKNTDLSFFLNS
jgi:hypothetical protein